jgi:hypothetical protein
MDLKEAFVEYDKANEVWEQAKAALEDATRARSETVKMIAGMVAPKKRILRAGKEFSIVARPVKSTGDTTYFMRLAGASPDDVVEVE